MIGCRCCSVKYALRIGESFGSSSFVTKTCFIELCACAHALAQSLLDPALRIGRAAKLLGACPPMEAKAGTLDSLVGWQRSLGGAAIQSAQNNLIWSYKNWRKLGILIISDYFYYFFHEIWKSNFFGRCGMHFVWRMFRQEGQHP